MHERRWVEVIVGCFVLLASAALIFLAVKVSGLVNFNDSDGYYLFADFANVGGLKVRAPVTIAGVRVGEVTQIDLEQDNFNARVTLLIHTDSTQLPVSETSARILTEGILGSNYISIVPGFSEFDDQNGTSYLQEGGQISLTQPALVLENIIGELIFNINS
ncbi:MAG: outer membrane lipid asymmetry maintenance protein MlaD [Gammaproteobacteria bacterium]